MRTNRFFKIVSLAVALAFVFMFAVLSIGCGHTTTSIEKDGFKLTVSDTQVLRERSIGGASYTRDADGAVGLSVNDAKSSTGGAADLLRAAAEAIEAR